MSPSLGSPTLILVPTELEYRRFLDHGGVASGRALVELCGFGPVAGAARTAQVLERIRPRRVLLLGIAGAFDVERDPVGSALEFGRVALDGVGVGQGESFRAPPALGFPQWPAGGRLPRAIEDELTLAGSESVAQLLTTCAASANEDERRQRTARFPDARCEDMEGFAVAFACALTGTPLRIVRGVSNEVGVRNPEQWNIPLALGAARRRALELLDSEAQWGVPE